MSVRNVDVVVNVLDCDIIVSEFELQSGYCVYFRINILGKSINPLSSQVWVAEGFRFMPLSLVRLRTFRLSTWVS